MGFKFALFCDLLSSLEANRTIKATSTVKKDEPDFQTIAKWFARHYRLISHPDTDRLALLSCMFPERRSDRVYWLQATSLTRVIGRCLGLGSSRISELNRWQKPGGPDLGQCVENVMRQAENYVPCDRQVSAEEIDEALNLIASRCRFSGPQVRRQHTAVDVDTVLSSLYRRLCSRDAKWLTRMILKSYAPVTLPEKYILEKFHFLLPHLLQFQNTFKGALEMLDSEPMNHFPPRPDRKLAASLCAIAVDHIRPRTGIKVGRPEYYKARSIKHCLQLTGHRRMSVERKYDGEYCQIHINLENKQTPIQIFSKSGKDSTADRSGLMPTLEDSLQMGSPQCKFTNRCILEGELLVWSDKRGDIADFHKLRKFLPRSGTFIGTENDSPPQPYEHLMIVFFDILLLDDNVCLRKPHRERRLLLKNIVRTIPGRSAIAEQEILSFDRPDSQHWLEASFSKAITQRWEGLVLKACDEPYFAIHSAGVDISFGRWIKLKKDYIPGLGDTVDLVLIGGYYDAGDATSLRIPKTVKWTHFLVACLLNKEDVLESRDSPRFRVIDVVGRHCMHHSLTQSLNQIGEFVALNPEDFHHFEIEYGHASLSQATKLFKKPFVVEIMGSGFEKPSGARYFTLRFPRIIKLHSDRSFEDAASFQELQVLAEEARSVSITDPSEERELWRKRLKVGSGLNEYIVQRSKTPSSRNSSAQPDSHSGPESPSETASDEDYSDSLPSSPPHQPSPQRAVNKQRLNKFDNAPALYVDETLLPIDLERSTPKPDVLSENENLSQRQICGQKNTASQDLENSTKIVTDESGEMKKTKATGSNGQKATSLISMHSQEISSREYATSGVKPPKSPLTTIPIYMSGTPSEFKSSTKPDDSLLYEFLDILGSDKTMSSLSESNPFATSKGMAFGIVLINTARESLGKEIHRMAISVSQAIQKSSCPLKGTIFFLDSLILEQNICPEDRNFCLRTTWTDLGKKYYFACVRWDVSDQTQPSDLSSGVEQDSRDPPALLVSFDQGDILALGEYICIDPPLLFNS